MIFVNSLLVAVGDIFIADPPLSGYNVDIGEPLNLDQDRTPWIGVNPGGLSAAGMQIAAGLPKGWDAKVDINIFHQSYTEATSGAALLSLMGDQQKILTAVASNTNASGQALMITDMTSDLFNDDNIQEHYLTNLITLTYDVRGSG